MLDNSNEMIKIPPEMRKSMEAMAREDDRTLKEMFRGRIRGSFLIMMKYQVMEAIGPMMFTIFDMKITREKLLTASDNAIQYEICNHITGTHRANTIFLTPEEKSKKERDPEYRKNLQLQVVENLVLRGFGSAYFRGKEFILSDRFNYYPVPYELWVMCLRINQIIGTNGPRSQYTYSYSLTMNKSLAALSLLEDNFLDSAYPLCRTVIEMYIKLRLSRLHPEIIPESAEFSYFDLEKSCCSLDYTDEFNSRFENRKNKSCHNKVDYLHYGFVDTIADYHDIIARNPYTISGIMEYLVATSTEDDSEKFNTLEGFYKTCNGYVHGNVIMAKYPLLHYFEISLILGNIIPDIYKMVCEEYDTDTVLLSTNLIGKFEHDFALMNEQYGRRSTELFELSQGEYSLESKNGRK